MTNSAIDTLIWQALETYPVKVLPQFLTDRSLRVRMAAARAVQLKGGDVEFEIATKMLKSTTFIDREMAAFVLGQLGSPKLPYRRQTIPLLEVLLITDRVSSVRSSAAVALGHLMATESVDFLIAAGTDPIPAVRAGVASALSRFPRNKKVKQCLDRLLNDASEKVRYWASD